MTIPNSFISSKQPYNCRYFEIRTPPSERLSLFGRHLQFATQHFGAGPVRVCETMHLNIQILYIDVQLTGGCLLAWNSALRRGRAPRTVDDNGLQGRGDYGVSGSTGSE